MADMELVAVQVERDFYRYRPEVKHDYELVTAMAHLVFLQEFELMGCDPKMPLGEVPLQPFLPWKGGRFSISPMFNTFVYRPHHSPGVHLRVALHVNFSDGRVLMWVSSGGPSIELVISDIVKPFGPEDDPVKAFVDLERFVRDVYLLVSMSKAAIEPVRLVLAPAPPAPGSQSGLVRPVPVPGPGPRVMVLNPRFTDPIPGLVPSRPDQRPEPGYFFPGSFGGDQGPPPFILPGMDRQRPGNLMGPEYFEGPGGTLGRARFDPYGPPRGGRADPDNDEHQPPGRSH